VAKWLKAEKGKKLFLYIYHPLSETIRRMTSRTTYFRGKFSKRPDDNNRALKNRISYYKKNITQVVAFFKKHYPFMKISTAGTIKEAKQRLLDKLENLNKHCVIPEFLRHVRRSFSEVGRAVKNVWNPLRKLLHGSRHFRLMMCFDENSG